MDVLENGSINQPISLDLHALRNLTEDCLKRRYGNSAPRPEVHSPDQSEGEVARVPIFPNLAKRYRGNTDQSLKIAVQDYLKEGNYKDAESVIQQKIQNKPDAYSYSLLGRIYSEQDRFEDAERAFTRALEVGPATAERYFELGMANYAQEKWKSAILYLKKAHELSPQTLRYEHFLTKAQSKKLPPIHIIILRLLVNTFSIDFVTKHYLLAISLLILGILILYSLFHVIRPLLHR
jgi:tetratricopeptide (TPR) repeat protein